MALEFKPLPPKEAVAYFQAKGYKFTWNWWEMWQADHHTAFTVAKAMRADILQDIREAVDKAIADGMSFPEFQKELEPILKKRGWWGQLIDPKTGKSYWAGTPWRLKTIFHVNTQVSYNVGRWRQITDPDVLRHRPFIQYIHNPCKVPRPAHLALDGKVLPADDPFWDENAPPNGWRCHCGVRSLSETEVKRRKFKVQSGKEVMKEAKDLGFKRDDIAPPEWRYNPGKTAFKPDFSKYEPNLQKSLKEWLDGYKPPEE